MSFRRALPLAAALLVGASLASGVSLAAPAEDTVMIQDFEAANVAVAPGGNMQGELVEDDSGVSSQALHVSFEPDADQWCYIQIPLDPFEEEYTTLRFRYKGTASKYATIFLMYDSGEERFSSTYIDKVAGWSTVEIPIKRFSLDGWQPDNATKNKKKDYPFKYLILSRDGVMKRGNDFVIDEIEVVKK